MTLGERIKACRKKVGMSQEKVAELVGVSRQAVTKWEMNQSAPSTENLFKLAEIFGTTVDMILDFAEETKESKLEQSCEHFAKEEEQEAMAKKIYEFYKREKEQELLNKKRQEERNRVTAFLVATGYIVIYLIGRMIWCVGSQYSVLGWLFTVRPSGKNSYLYGWLLSSNLFWYAMIISVIPTFFGKHKFAYTTLMGFVIGILLGMIFGPNPEGEAWGNGHYGWAIWGAIYLVSMLVGIIVEKYQKKSIRR